MVKKILLCCLLTLAACDKIQSLGSGQSQICSRSNVTFQINQHNIFTEVACSDEQRAYGLMNRDSLPKNNGMLFVFNSLDIHPFWMKNTRIPLSIAYIDESWHIVDIREMKAMDLTPVVPAGKALYAIEANAGWFSQNGIKIGDQVKMFQFNE